MGDRAAAVAAQKLSNKFSRQNAALGAETRAAASRCRIFSSLPAAGAFVFG